MCFPKHEVTCFTRTLLYTRGENTCQQLYTLWALRATCRQQRSAHNITIPYKHNISTMSGMQLLQLCSWKLPLLILITIASTTGRLLFHALHLLNRNTGTSSRSIQALCTTIPSRSRTLRLSRARGPDQEVPANQRCILHPFG